MTPDEAKEETIKQFEAQGINLANIIKDLTINKDTGESVLKETIDYLNTNPTDVVEIEKKLEALIEECNQTVPHRVLAAKLGAYDKIMNLLETNEKARLKAILAANAMINKNPDIFNEKSFHIISKLLKEESSKDIINQLLRFMQKACVLHEINRQTIMGDESLFDVYRRLLDLDDMDIIKDLCALFRSKILDDDIRVEFGKAHEHARTLATAFLKDLTQLLTKYKSNQELVCDLFLTIASLTVRNEFCLVVEEAGGLKFIMDVMVEYPSSIKIQRESLKLLKALAGNDAVKSKIIQNGAAPLIESALNSYKDNEVFARHALLCISTLALRDKNNSVALYEAGIAENIIQAMKIHKDSKAVQRNGSWAIRNMVSRSREQCETFINHGAEDVLNTALANHPSIAQDVKSALRDVGLKVLLNEEWKGKSEYQIQRD